LTKLDLEREIESIKHEKSFRPGILDFLANYHELKELDNKPLEELYEEIEKNRIKEHT
jgi:hypothetical protein